MTNARKGTRAPAVFSWTTGENTNVGDSLLRRPYLATQAAVGPVDVWIRRSTRDFLDGLDVPADARLERSFPRWYAGLWWSAIRRQTFVFLNAGEFRVRPSGAVLLIPITLAAIAVRMRGGAAMWLGVSVPQSDRRLLRLVYRLAFRQIDYVQWREAGSVEAIGSRPVGPDWGFAEGPPIDSITTEPRNEIAFVLRGDRPAPSEGWLEWARRLSARYEALPTVVVQVRQDQARALEVARALGGTVLEWPEDLSHPAQEKRLRELYSRCAVVVGDRLHGLVLAATEGAVPLGWVESSGGKIRRHFEAIGLESPGQHEGQPVSKLPDPATLDFSDIQHATLDAIADARVRINELRSAVARVATPSHGHGLAHLGRPDSRARSRASLKTSE